MTVLIRFLAGLLLIVHGLIHLLYLAQDIEEFTLDRSWLVPAPARRPVAFVLMSVTVAGFLLVGLAVWGVPLLAGAWSTLTVVASVVSLVLLATYWDSRLIFGVAIDLVLIVLAVTRPVWTESIG